MTLPSCLVDNTPQHYRTPQCLVSFPEEAALAPLFLENPHGILPISPYPAWDSATWARPTKGLNLEKWGHLLLHLQRTRAPAVLFCKYTFLKSRDLERLANFHLPLYHGTLAVSGLCAARFISLKREIK